MTNPPAELLVYDGLETCPYLPDRLARMPLRLPTRRLLPLELDDRLARGDRRSGPYLYRTACPSCQACQPIRLDVERFVPSRTQRRVKRRGDRLLRTELGPPRVDRQRIELLNRHRRQRGLAQQLDDMSADQYEAFLVGSCCETLEIAYFLEQQLVAVAISDRGAASLSAVYCYYDTRYGRLSLGTYSILKQLELCQRWQSQHLYLGLYIAQSPHMSYKARFVPHERLIRGRWQSIEGKRQDRKTKGAI